MTSLVTRAGSLQVMTSDTKQYWTKQDDLIGGPISAAKVKSMIQSGEITPIDFIAQSSNGPWILAPSTFQSHLQRKDWSYYESGFSADTTQGPFTGYQLVRMRIQKKILPATPVFQPGLNNNEWINFEDTLLEKCSQFILESRERTRQVEMSNQMKKYEKEKQEIELQERQEVELQKNLRDAAIASASVGKLAKHWPLGSLVLVCHKCQQQTFVADDCGWCGWSHGQHLATHGISGKNWYFGDVNEGGHGYFCSECKNGYTSAECDYCGQHNAVAVSNFHVMGGKPPGTLSGIEIAWTIIVIALGVLFAIAMMASDA